MTGKLKPYLKYKDSGVEWLGEVPESWIISKLKHYISTTKGFALMIADMIYAEKADSALVTKCRE
ncbi:hypothetical protein [Cysteiniphilum halobium]|uniref:hypothetical protein n=1 Tax=Cysteiniphilum halobium TaxID=2219059 RepID=UPI000E651CD5|nr:hypothetical protein [Cysteiniphilum halobium]